MATIYPKSVTWNGNTWDTTTGGPIEATITHAGQVVSAWTGDATWAQFTGVIDAGCHVTVRLQDVKTIIATPNTKADLVLTVSDGKPTPTTTTLTVANAVFVGSTHTQPHGLGDLTLELDVESADGTTAPVV